MYMNVCLCVYSGLIEYGWNPHTQHTCTEDRKKRNLRGKPDFFRQNGANENDVDDGNYLNWMRYYFRYRLYYCYSNLAKGLFVMMECLECI
jgi:hypothetical protein